MSFPSFPAMSLIEEASVPISSFVVTGIRRESSPSRIARAALAISRMGLVIRRDARELTNAMMITERTPIAQMMICICRSSA